MEDERCWIGGGGGPSAGPWFVGLGSLGGPNIYVENAKGGHRFIGSVNTAQLHFGPPVQLERNEPEAVANARLIAAAPDLLDACRGVAEARSREELNAAIEAARAALAKARAPLRQPHRRSHRGRRADTGRRE